MTGQPSAKAAGTIGVGGDLTVNRLGFGAMRITGQGIWGDLASSQASATWRGLTWCRSAAVRIGVIRSASWIGAQGRKTSIS